MTKTRQPIEPETPKRPPAETFREAAERILERLAADPQCRANYGREGLKAEERLSRLRRWVFDAIGDIPVDKLQAADFAGVHAEAVRAGLSEQHVIPLRNDLGLLLGELLSERAFQDNVLDEAIELLIPQRRASYPDNLPDEAIELLTAGDD